ncbi:MAG: hypothetical protein WCF35_13380, partial [Pseudolabrys sp.]
AGIVDHLDRELGGCNATHTDLRHASSRRIPGRLLLTLHIIAFDMQPVFLGKSPQTAEPHCQPLGHSK